MLLQGRSRRDEVEAALLAVLTILTLFVVVLVVSAPAS
jgi:hypothetical protein